MTQRAIGARHALDARVRARLARRVVAETQVRIEPGRTLLHARARRLDHGGRSTRQTVLIRPIAARLAGIVTRLALRTGPELTR